MMSAKMVLASSVSRFTDTGLNEYVPSLFFDRCTSTGWSPVRTMFVDRGVREEHCNSSWFHQSVPIRTQDAAMRPNQAQHCR